MTAALSIQCSHRAAIRHSGLSDFSTGIRMAAPHLIAAARRLVGFLIMFPSMLLAAAFSDIKSNFFAGSTTVTGLRAIPARKLEDGWLHRQQTPTGATWVERPRRAEPHTMHALSGFGCIANVQPCRW